MDIRGQKVWCVFESSDHTDIYDRDNDGKFLVDLYESEKDAWERVLELSRKVSYDPDSDDITTCAMSYVELTVRDNTDMRGVDCLWTWSMEPMEVK